MGFDETIAALDHILQAERARKEGPLALLRSTVRGLDGGLLPSAEDVVGRDERPERRLGVTTQARPFVPMPRRTTHGGRFGPAVIAKLREHALR